jgi:hypothetical protein
MPKFEISVDLPKGVDVIRIQQSKDGWEATCLSHATVDKYEVAVPGQFGQAFKHHTPGQAIKVAADMARAATAKLVSQRNAKPDPRLSPEEQLLKQLGLA